MLDYTYLLSIAIILFSTKVFGFLTEKIKLPQVVGALLAGVIIGPSMLGIVKDTAFLDQVSQIGVIIAPAVLSAAYIRNYSLSALRRFLTRADNFLFQRVQPVIFASRSLL